MSRFTPGPWEFGQQGDGLTAECYCVFAPKTNLNIARTPQMDSDDFCNARLISACPEMIEALQSAQNYLEGVLDQYSGEAVPSNLSLAILKVEKAIAKANGVDE